MGVLHARKRRQTLYCRRTPARGQFSPFARKPRQHGGTMKPTAKQMKQTGFTLIEMMVSVTIFVILSGAMFGLLALPQKRHQTEAQLLDTYQQARVGLGKIVREAT